MFRSLNLPLIALYLVLLAGGPGQSCSRIEKESGKPNIIFIMAADLGIGDLGCYGQDIIQTPHIDELVSRGMLFTRHYTGNTVCAPSRCALMTGYHRYH